MKGTLLVVMVALALAVTPVTPPAADDSPNAPLVDAVRRATEPFKDVTAATAAGYAAFLGCVSGPSEGAMGIHFVNGALVGDGQIDVLRPEALMYEPKTIATASPPSTPSTSGPGGTTPTAPSRTGIRRSPAPTTGSRAGPPSRTRSWTV